jgi:hypothetical protein
MVNHRLEGGLIFFRLDVPGSDTMSQIHALASSSKDYANLCVRPPNRMDLLARQIAARFLEGRSAPALVMDMARKYAHMLGLSELPRISIKDNLGSHWLGRCIFRIGQQNVMEIQKSAMFDEVTLERVVAHEMCHHAEYLALTDQDLAKLKVGIRPPSHGKQWEVFAAKVNSVMGSGYVTETSDSSHILAPETKPYSLLIVEFGGGRLGYAVGVRITPKMQEFINRYIEKGGRVVKTTDPRWANAPRIGDGRFGVPPKPEDQGKLRALYEGAA